MKKTKNIPAIVMLLGCAVAVIVTYINGYSLEGMLKVLIAVLFIFLFIGLFIKRLFEKYIPPTEDIDTAIGEDGAVIEKPVEEDIAEGGLGAAETAGGADDDGAVVVTEEQSGEPVSSEDNV